jgi:hypothetical protein
VPLLVNNTHRKSLERIAFERRDKLLALLVVTTFALALASGRQPRELTTPAIYETSILSAEIGGSELLLCNLTPEPITPVVNPCCNRAA